MKTAPSPQREPRRPRSASAILVWVLPLTLVALGAAFSTQATGRVPHFWASIFSTAVFASLLFAPTLFGRWRMKQLLWSGDVERIVGAWEASARQGSAKTKGTTAVHVPLLQATAYAAYGWVDAARRSLGRARSGPTWDASVEQRLMVETLLDTFEGDRSAALAKAAALEAMPVPGVGFFARRRIASLRAGMSALARAFAHVSLPGDERVLRRAASASPLVYWAMRYASAIVSVDRGRVGEAAELLADAPSWPVQSAFRTYQAELLSRAPTPAASA